MITRFIISMVAINVIGLAAIPLSLLRYYLVLLSVLALAWLIVYSDNKTL